MANCSICHHPKLREITQALIGGASCRGIASSFGVSKSSVDRHMTHSTKILSGVGGGAREEANALMLATPILNQARFLTSRVLSILEKCEEAKDYGKALAAIGEYRKGLELIGRLTGELDPKGSEAAAGPVQVIVQYVDVHPKGFVDSKPKQLDAPIEVSKEGL